MDKVCRLEVYTIFQIKWQICCTKSQLRRPYRKTIALHKDTTESEKSGQTDASFISCLYSPLSTVVPLADIPHFSLQCSQQLRCWENQNLLFFVSPWSPTLSAVALLGEMVLRITSVPNALINPTILPSSLWLHRM